MPKLTIELDNPTSLHPPGTLITGRAKVSLNKPIVLGGLWLIFEGYANVTWYSAQRERNSARQTYLLDEVRIWGNNSTDSSKLSIDSIMPAGNHVFSFSFSLPMNLPGSFYSARSLDEVAEIRYLVRARMDRSVTRFDTTVEEEFGVAPSLDLNTIWKVATTPGTGSDTKTICCFCCQGGVITCNVSIPKTGYVNGETIQATIEIFNKSRKMIEEVSMVLMQSIRFRPDAKSLFLAVTNKSTILAASAKTEPIPPGRSTKWITKGLPVPDVLVAPPSLLFPCNEVLEIRYNIIVLVLPSGCSQRLEIRIPIVIGTVAAVTSISCGSTQSGSAQSLNVT